VHVTEFLHQTVRDTLCWPASLLSSGNWPGSSGGDARGRQPVRPVRQEGVARAPGDGVHRSTGYVLLVSQLSFH
jgi:hypothetical protein